MSLRIIGSGYGWKSPDPEWLPPQLPKGWSSLFTAVELWRLLGDARADRLQQELRSSRPDEQGRQILSLEQIARLIELTTGLEQDVTTLTDAAWRLRPEHRDRVLEEVPHLVTSWDERGRRVDTLANAVNDVVGVRGYLAAALKAREILEVD